VKKPNEWAPVSHLTERSSIYDKRNAFLDSVAGVNDKPQPECIYHGPILNKMAKVLNVSSVDVETHRGKLDAAAAGYRSRKLWKVASAKKDLIKVEGLCRKLLAVFGIEQIEAAQDGPGPAGAALVRAFAVVRDEDWLRDALQIIGHASRIFDELAVAAKEATSYQAAPRTTDKSDHAKLQLAVRGSFGGNAPDLAIDEFVVDILRVYEEITGKTPTVTNNPGDAKVSGRCFDFVQVTGKVIGVEITGNQLHRIVNAGRKKKPSAKNPL
jgi:hypothetical protein